MATTIPTRTAPPSFDHDALADLVEQAMFALDELAAMDVIELPRPLHYWQSEFRALAAALDGAPETPCRFYPTGIRAPQEQQTDP